MFELGGERAVAGHRRPAVVEHLAVGPADVDHRLDGEEHAGPELRPGPRPAGVDDLRRIVEDPAHAVAAEIAHHGVTVPLGMALDRMGDIAEPVARLRLLQPEHQAFVGHLDELGRLDADVADQIHPAGVAVPAVEHRRHVDIDDVAILQRPIGRRNAVADDMVDRGAAALGIAAIAQGRGNRAARPHLGEDDLVQLLRRHPRHDVGNEHVEHFRGATPGGAHAGEALRPVQLDIAMPAGDGRVVGISRRSHHADIARRTLICTNRSVERSPWPTRASGPPPCW